MPSWQQRGIGLDQGPISGTTVLCIDILSAKKGMPVIRASFNSCTDNWVQKRKIFGTQLCSLTPR